MKQQHIQMLLGSTPSGAEPLKGLPRGAHKGVQRTLDILCFSTTGALHAANAI
jgi:hypothetical protein